jgi:ribonuclease HII
MAVADSPVLPTFKAERELFRAGFLRVAGVDEAGRGPLAGPVVAAAVVLDPKRIPRGLADSKLLDRDERESLFAKLCATAEISFAFGSVTAIDRINILQATLVAMRRAVMGLAQPADAVLIDGNVLPKGLPCEARAIVGGDASSKSVAAASIVAKVIRDRLMTRCDTSFSGYGLASHKGYSTREHQTALTALGPCRLHRRSFWRVAACFENAAEPGAEPSPPCGEWVAAERLGEGPAVVEMDLEGPLP